MEETVQTEDLKSIGKLLSDNLKARDASASKNDRPGDDGTLRSV